MEKNWVSGNLPVGNCVMGGLLTKIMLCNYDPYYLLSWDKTKVLQSVSPVGSSGTELLIMSP